MLENNDMMINHAIKIDIKNLPKIIQNTIKELEEYATNDDWDLCDNLESFLKSALLAEK